MISVYGAGYVGLVSAVCFAKIGHQVLCADINKDRIARLKRGDCPIYEEHLPDMLVEQLEQGRLVFTDNLSDAIKKNQIHFIATGTPGLPDGSADLSQVIAVASQIAKETLSDAVVVTKSTVPVGTGDTIEKLMANELKERALSYRIDVVSNPEFLREGTAVLDFLEADRIVLGGNEHALSPLKTIYQPLVNTGIPLVCMSRTSAELTKYTANAMLACKISFINQISRIAERVGADIDEIRDGIALDKRIGSHFLRPGIGYGGSCFPKDSRALIQTAHSLEINAPLLEAIEAVNYTQKTWVFEKLNEHFHSSLNDRCFAVWGLSFKPNTDDLREASSLVIIRSLLDAGARIKLYDPVAMPVAKKLLPHDSSLTWCDDAEAALTDGVDGLIIATEWSEFLTFPLARLAELLKSSPVFDGRNCYKLTDVQSSKIASYYSVGRPLISSC